MADYDLPANGGNGDGWIDSRDSIFSKLRFWVDKNHNGVSDPGETFNLKQLGIERVSLKYSVTKHRGQFEYRSLVIWKDKPGGSPWMLDVFVR